MSYLNGERCLERQQWELKWLQIFEKEEKERKREEKDRWVREGEELSKSPEDKQCELIKRFLQIDNIQNQKNLTKLKEMEKDKEDEWNRLRRMENVAVIDGDFERISARLLEDPSIHWTVLVFV